MTALVDTSLLLGSLPIEDLGEPWVVSVVSVGEQQAGILLARDDTTRAARLARLAAVLAEAPIVAVDRTVAGRYGELRAAAGRGPTNDLWIAATALAHDFTLVTADGRQASLPLVRATLVS